ncbi:unnamed protein product [Brassica rapa]|uniref:DUF1985 domain-containing protein n=1 Tax=Brassica campestris TaxID=3711 RepID=A0A3P6AWX2_BRACM|nr:unnamed protein product [Brassica rapa]VDC90200.1 unnamed protein product [Brassica rapa]
MGLDIDAGPISLQIIATWKKNSSPTRAMPARLVMNIHEFETYPWGRLAFKWLMDSVKCKDLTSNCYTIDGFVQVLQVWIYVALPDFAASFGKPIRNRPTPPLLAYNGQRGIKCGKECLYTQTRVFKYVAKEIGEMYPTWENDAVDVSVKNLVEFMFAKPEWKWTQECWPAQGTKQ